MSPVEWREMENPNGVVLARVRMRSDVGMERLYAGESWWDSNRLKWFSGRDWW